MKSVAKKENRNCDTFGGTNGFKGHDFLRYRADERGGYVGSRIFFFMVRPSDSIVFDLVLFDSGSNSLNELNRSPAIKGFVRLLLLP